MPDECGDKKKGVDQLKRYPRAESAAARARISASARTVCGVSGFVVSPRAMITESSEDQANAVDYPAFLGRMETVFSELYRVLREGRYAVVIVRDAYQGGRYLFTGSDLAARAGAAGFIPKGDLIWYQAGTRLRPYGYPRSFVPNIVHQHILVLRMETSARQAPRRRDSR